MPHAPEDLRRTVLIVDDSPEDLRRTVLIVDDSPFMRCMLRGILEMGGYRVVAEAADGVEAVEKYLHHRPAMTVMDSVMPPHGGLAAVRAILAADAAARIVLSSVANAELVRQAEAAGACGVIGKPFGAEEVLAVLGGL